MDGKISPSTIKSTDLKIPFTNYSDYLLAKGIKEYNASEHYLQVKEPNSSQGWIIYISIWKSHFPQIIDALLSYLIMHNYSFKIPLNTDIHDMINYSNLGYSNQGKIIIIIPHADTNLSKLLSDLNNFTADKKGTNVPSAINIGHLIYVKYGSYENTESKSIVDPMGNNILDLDSVPPILYNWIDWPFTQIERPKSSPIQRIIHNRYFIKKIIKNDAKGFVIKTLYQQNLIRYKTCILKEGKVGMLEDDFGRDVEDRLKWQFQIHKNLSKYIPIPKVIDLFKENDNTYLALDYIKGASLGTYLGEIFNGNQWADLKTKDKIIIINILISITEIIYSLHEKKFIHRDINPENFIVTKKHKIWLIDLELTYDLHNKAPNPPFEKGTEGYMSTEQFLKLEPTIEQDYYSIGSLIVMSITQFNPYRLNRDNKTLLRKNLNFFIDDQEIIELIISCFHDNPKHRPSPKQIIKALLDFKLRIIEKSNTNLYPGYNIEKDSLKQLIGDALNTMGSPIMLNLDGIWLSPVSPIENAIGNIRIDRTVFCGLRKGISGILMFLSEAALASFNLNSCKDTIEANWIYLKNFIKNTNNPSLGLYSGLAGIAFSMDSMIKSSLIPNNEENIKIIIDCLSKLPLNLDISSGVAGFGLALIKCSSRLPIDFTNIQLKQCIEVILKKQLPNGSWIFDETDKNLLTVTGFDHGIAGIIYFLLIYSERYNDSSVKSKAINALNYLKSSAKKYQNSYVWPVIIGRKDFYKFSNGDYLILRPFIKAYKLTNNITYRQLAEKVLTAYPEHVSADWLSQEGGLAGLGEVYLDAWLTFENYDWFKRAEWIAKVLMHNLYGTDNNTYWIQELPHYPSADLLTGNSGIIRFLLRIYSLPNDINFLFDL